MPNPFTSAEPQAIKEAQFELSPTALLYLTRARGADGRRRRVNRR